MYHEFGHGLGMKHARTGIMVEGGDANQRFADAVFSSNIEDCLGKGGLGPNSKWMTSQAREIHDVRGNSVLLGQPLIRLNGKMSYWPEPLDGTILPKNYTEEEIAPKDFSNGKIETGEPTK